MNKRVNLDALTSKIYETATAAKGKLSLYIKLRERGQQTHRANNARDLCVFYVSSLAARYDT